MSFNTYLLVTAWADGELDDVTARLPTVAKCRALLEALSDAIARGDRLAQGRTEAVVGALLGQKLHFARDEDWRSACRTLLLRRALELSGRDDNEADRAADLLRDLYREQGLALGLDGADLQGQTSLTAVLERLIGHVAGRADLGKLAPADRAHLEQAGRQVQAARFAADNDLAYAVLLQRIWVKVLALTLSERAPAQAKKSVRAVPEELDKKDREASSLLDQLRSGEESALRAWALAHDLKVK